MVEEHIAHMTLAGLIFWVVSWTIIAGLTVYCTAKVLKSSGKKGRDRAPLE